MAANFVQIQNDSEIKKRLEAERARLRQIAGLDQPTHFHRPVERAFTAEERGRVTILFGGFTWKHEDLIRAVFQGCGYRCEKLPVPDVPAFQNGDAGANPCGLPRHREPGKPCPDNGNIDIQIERKPAAVRYRRGVRSPAGTCESLAHIVSS